MLIMSRLRDAFHAAFLPAMLIAVVCASASAQTLNPSSASVAMGNAAIGTTISKNLTLSTLGTTPITISAIVATSSYSETDNCTAPVTKTTPCTVSVAFAPATLGSKPGSLTITSNATNSTLPFH